MVDEIEEIIDILKKAYKAKVNVAYNLGAIDALLRVGIKDPSEIALDLGMDENYVRQIVEAKNVPAEPENNVEVVETGGN